MSVFLSTVLPYLLSALAGVVLKHVFPQIPVPLIPSPTPAPVPAPPQAVSHPIFDELAKAKDAFMKAAEQAFLDALLKNLPSLPAPVAPAPKS